MSAIIGYISVLVIAALAIFGIGGQVETTTLSSSEDINLAPTQPSSNMQTYSNARREFSIQIPSNWFTQEVSHSGPWRFQSTDFRNNLEGVGIPPEGNLWIGISKGCLDEPTADFVHEGNVSRQIMCSSGFEIELGVWSNDSDSQHLSLLDTIAASFKSEIHPSISVPGMTKYTDTDFGFSFWYPSGWIVNEVTPESPDRNGWYQDVKIVKQIK